MLKHNDYDKIITTIHKHFNCDRRKYYIKSIRNEWDISPISFMDDQPLFEYIKPNNTYYIQFEERVKSNKCLWIIPLAFPNVAQNMESAIKYQYKGPLKISQGSESINKLVLDNMAKAVYKHFDYDLWNEVELYFEYQHGVDVSPDSVKQLRPLDCLNLLNSDHDDTKAHIVYIKIISMIKLWPDSYIFKYISQGAQIKISKQQFDALMNGHNDFDKLKQYLFNRIYNDRLRCRKMQNVIIYNFNPKYDSIRYKWYRKFHRKAILPMYIYEDKPVVHISEINRNQIYYVYCQGVWTNDQISDAKSHWDMKN